MPTSLMSWLMPSLIGGLGLMQSSDAQASGNKAVNFQEQAAAPGIAANQQLLQNAENYNPAQQNQAAIGQATSQTQNVLSNAIKGMDAQYASAGGVPGQSTASDVQSQTATNQVLGPFAQQVAQMIANEPFQKAQMLQSVNQAPVGQMAQTYFKNAEVQNASAPTASAGMLGQAVQQFMKTLQPGTAGANPTTGGGYQQPINPGGQTLPGTNYAYGTPGDNLGWGTTGSNPLQVGT